MNKITLENYKQFKPSDLIARGVHDMFDAIESGHDIVTYDWFGYNDTTSNCFVCLGGAVLRGMIPDIKRYIDSGEYVCALNTFRDSRARSTVQGDIAGLFDSIRKGATDSVIFYLKELYGLRPSVALFHAVNYQWKNKCFVGYLGKSEVEQLSKSIFSLVDALRSVGL